MTDSGARDPSRPTHDERGDPAAFLATVREAFATFAPSERLDDLRVLASGLEFVVLRGRTDRWGHIAIRVPWSRFFHNENDPWIDSRELLEQEAHLLRHARQLGLPVPRVFGLHQGTCDVLVTELVETDGSPPSGHEIGTLLRQLHDAPPPSWMPHAQRSGDLAEVLAERIVRRCRVVQERSGTSFAVPSQTVIASLLASTPNAPRLLHMDFRAANLLVAASRIRGIVDWSNAIVGDPALEVARIAEYEETRPDFFEGYGVTDPSALVPRPLELVYRLDAAVMLGVVFLSEAPDPSRAPRQVERVVQLARALATAL